MPGLHELFRRIRESAALEIETLARLLDLSVDEVAAAETAGLPEPALVDRYARLFGLSVPALLRGEANDGPAAVLFRSMRNMDGGLSALAEVKAHRVLGEFLQCVHHASELHEALAQPRRSAFEWPAPEALPGTRDGASIVQQAEQLALEVRRRLGLVANRPIASALELVRGSLGIDVFFVDVDTLTPDIDGASALHPSPAILVNLLGGPRLWWRTRMTLMHELCHLLFDRASFGANSRGFVLFSPDMHARRHNHWQLVERFDDLERRANAFAAFMLAPTAGIRDVVGADAPGPEHVQHICNVFGVGRTVAINRVQNVLGLSHVARQTLEEQCKRQVIARDGGPDEVGPEAIGFAPPWFVGLVDEGLRSEAIDRIDARRYLGLGLAEPLGSDPPVRPRWRDAEDRAVLHVMHHAGVGIVFSAGVQELSDGSFEVQIARRLADGEDIRLGPVEVTRGLEIRPIRWLSS